MKSLKVQNLPLDLPLYIEGVIVCYLYILSHFYLDYISSLYSESLYHVDEYITVCINKRMNNESQ